MPVETSTPTQRTLRRMMAEAKSPLPDQAPAIQCAITLTGGMLTVEGSLSETPEGGLRMLRPDEQGLAQLPRHRRGDMTNVPMLEHYFEYADVLAVTIRRTVSTEAPRILPAS